MKSNFDIFKGDIQNVGDLERLFATGEAEPDPENDVVGRVPLPVGHGEENRAYLVAKRDLMGHLLDLDAPGVGAGSVAGRRAAGGAR